MTKPARERLESALRASGARHGAVRCSEMARLGDALARRLARGYVGKVARIAVRQHPHIYGDGSRITIESDVVLNDALLNCSSGTIRIAKHAFLGHNVSLLTGTHDYRQFGAARKRAVPEAGRDIVIGEGAWIASSVTVLGPCRIGDHSVVTAGAVVTEDVAPYSVVGGVPARVLSQIEAR